MDIRLLRTPTVAIPTYIYNSPELYIDLVQTCLVSATLDLEEMVAWDRVSQRT